ncbi:MAG: hypothetical protein FOGNACKC_02916 [Anaerolineae bacterium]|nr:hypothetical protein [Anaerolineae bacterium]
MSTFSLRSVKLYFHSQGSLRQFIPWLIGLLLLFLLPVYPAAAAGPTSSDPQPVPPGLLFIENVGQFEAAARFQVIGAGNLLWLTDDGFWLAVVEPAPAIDRANPAAFVEQTPRRSTRLKISFPGAKPHPRLEPFNRLPTKVSYFRGNNPANWRADVPVWGGVRYVDLYPGIDLEISGNAGQLTPRLVVRNEAALAKVRLKVEGATQVGLQDNRLQIQTAFGTATVPLLEVMSSGQKTAKSLPQPELQGLELAAPFAATTGTVAATLTTTGSGLLYSTFLSGAGAEWGQAVAVDATGSAYVTGFTSSSDFLDTTGTTMATRDVFVVKANPTGSDLVYVTFLGGDSDDWGQGLALDPQGNTYLTGLTYSSNFPVPAGLYPGFGGGVCDAFVAKLNADGTALLYGTFLGGAGNDSGNDIALDAANNIYVTGNTNSPDFPHTATSFDPTYNGGYMGDAFVVKLNAAGNTLVYGAFLGGSSGHDSGIGITVDPAGNAYVTGNTEAPNFPTTPGVVDTNFGSGVSEGFVVKVNPAGSQKLYATLLGGDSDRDWGSGIAVDAAGNAYITGATASTDFPATFGSADTICGNGMPGNCISGGTTWIFDAFVAKLNPTGMALIYATYLGGNLDDQGRAIAVDASGQAYVTGSTASPDFPHTANAVDESYNNGGDAFVVKVNPAGTAWGYATYLGGTFIDVGYDLALDEVGNVLLTGRTTGDFPVTPGAFDTTYGGNDEAYLAKLPLAPLSLTVTDTSLELNDDGWPTPNPLTATVTLLCPADGPNCTGPFNLTIGSTGNARFFMYAKELGAAGDPMIVDCAESFNGPTQYSHNSYLGICTRDVILGSTTFTVLAGEAKTLYWRLWVQPSVAANLDVAATWGTNVVTQTVQIPQAQIRPLVLLPGYLGTYPPEFGPEYGGGGHIDPLYGYYDNLMDGLEQAGYEKGLAGSGATLIPFPYDWQLPLGNTGSITLTAHIQLIQNSNNQKDYANYSQVDLIAHSAGGLVARAYLERNGINNDHTVHTLVTLGTPHRGVPGAYVGRYGGDPDPLIPKPEFNNLLSGIMFCKGKRVEAGNTLLFPPESYYEYFSENAPSIEDFIPRADDVSPPYLIDGSGTPFPYPTPPGSQKPPSPFLDDLNTSSGSYDIIKLGNIPRIISSYASNYTATLQYQVETPPSNPLYTDFWKYGTATLPVTQISGDLLVPAYSANLTEITALTPYTNITAYQEGVGFDINDPATWPPTHVGFTYVPYMVRRIISYTTGIDVSADKDFWNIEYVEPFDQFLTGVSCAKTRILITDPLGRRAGLDLSSGQVINEIPGALVTEGGIEPQLIMLPNNEGMYEVEGIGLASGDYQIGVIRGITDPIVIKSLEGTTVISQTHDFVFTNPPPPPIFLPILFKNSAGVPTLLAPSFDNTDSIFNSPIAKPETKITVPDPQPTFVSPIATPVQK